MLTMTVTPWLTRTGQLWYLFRETWMNQRQVRCQPGHKASGMSDKTCEILSLDAAITNPSHRVLTRRCVKHCLQRDDLDEIEMSALHSERKRRNTAPSVSKEPDSGNGGPKAQRYIELWITDALPNRDSSSQCQLTCDLEPP